MRWAAKARLRLRSLFWRERLGRELGDELRFHLEQAVREKVAAGMSREEARDAALRDFGGVEQVREECVDVRRLNWFYDLVQDVRYGLRMLGKSPGFTTVAVLTLALGIGANTAIFSVVDAVLLKPLPYPQPSKLVSVTMAEPAEGIPTNGTSYDDFREWQGQNHVFAGIAGFQSHNLTLTGRGEPLTVETAVITPGLFSLLGVNPIVGRTFLPEDGREGAPAVVVLNEALWRDRFGGDPSVVGTSISLDHKSYTVIGVMPASFRYPPLDSTEHVWIPLEQDPVFGPWMDRKGGHWLRVIARIKPGVSLAEAQAEMDTIGARLAAKFPAENTGWVIRLVPLQQQMVGSVKTALMVLLGSVGLVLLIACANVSNLLLSRATSRIKEMALRAALGAGRGRIVRQLLTESAVLGSLGGLAGVLLAYWGVRGLASRLPANLPQANTIRLDGSVLAFALGLSIFTSFLFGLAPTLFAAGSDLETMLKQDTGRSVESGARRLARDFLAAAEVALAMVVLVGAGLLGRSFLSLTGVKPGFEVQNRMKSGVELPLLEYSKPEQWRAFGDELLRRLEAQPGMHDTAIAVPLPLVDGFINLAFEIVGNPPLPPGRSQDADYASVSPNYFRVMGIPLLRGRWFSERDRDSSPPVTVISEALAQRYFPNQDPIGKQLSFDFPPSGITSHEIVGIVGDVRDVGLGQPPGAMMYVPFAQAPFWEAEIVVESGLSAANIAAAIRQQVHAMDKDLPVGDVKLMSEAVDESVEQPRLRTVLVGLFAGMALVLAAAGIFGVMSYSVSRRTHEIGIRMALGASATTVQRLVLAESAKLVLIGLAAGILTALGLSRLLSNLLFAVRPTDPLTFVGVGILLIAVALAASYVPTRRAMHVDPLVALRHE
jgi:putative ABC transport system permease protein